MGKDYIALKDADTNALLESLDLEQVIFFMNAQVREPFNTHNNNFLKKIHEAIKEEYEDDNKRIRELYSSVCKDVLEGITKSYDNHISINPKNDEDITNIARCVYKFTIKNIYDVVYSFLKEYLMSNKNRKNLVAMFADAKTNNYPKETFGNKNNFILISKLSNIVEFISKDSEIEFDEFLKYVKKNIDSSVYVEEFCKYYENNIISDDGKLYSKIMKTFLESDEKGSVINEIKAVLLEKVVTPSISIDELRFEGDTDPIEESNDDSSDE